MDAGALVPDDVIIGVILDRLKESDAQDGFLLDGFPRTVPQAEALGAALKEFGRQLTAVLLIDVSDDEVVRRLSGRRVSAKTGRVYHVEFDPPKRDGVCDVDGSRLIQRDDDKPGPSATASRSTTSRPSRSSATTVRKASSVASTASARPPRSTTTSVRRSQRCASRTALAGRAAPAHRDDDRHEVTS